MLSLHGYSSLVDILSCDKLNYWGNFSQKKIKEEEVSDKLERTGRSGSALSLGK